MKFEEIKAIGLHGGDIVCFTKNGHRYHEVFRYLHKETESVYFDGLRWVDVSEIVAIERMMPELPDGHEWCTGRFDGVLAAIKFDGRAIATIDAIGQMQCFEYDIAMMCPIGHSCIPALVAKALLEVWEARQRKSEQRR